MFQSMGRGKCIRYRMDYKTRVLVGSFSPRVRLLGLVPEATLLSPCFITIVTISTGILPQCDGVCSGFPPSIINKKGLPAFLTVKIRQRFLLSVLSIHALLSTCFMRQSLKVDLSLAA